VRRLELAPRRRSFAVGGANTLHFTMSAAVVVRTRSSLSATRPASCLPPGSVLPGCCRKVLNESVRSSRISLLDRNSGASRLIRRSTAATRSRFPVSRASSASRSAACANMIARSRTSGGEPDALGSRSVFGRGGGSGSAIKGAFGLREGNRRSAINPRLLPTRLLANPRP
jgi:hypothetical protein